MASATDNFDSYSDGSSLNDAANWTVNQGAFTIVNPTESAGTTRSNASATICLARYNATSFQSDQACEVVIGGTASGGGEQGPAVRVQAGAATGYYAYGHTNDVYLVAIVAGTYTYETYASESFTPGDIVRIEASGAGSSARVSLYVDHGSGFSAIVENHDFGAGYYIDNGDPGIAGYGISTNLSITDWLGEDLTTNADGDVDFTTEDITFASIAGQNAEADADFTTEDITFAAIGGGYEADADFTTEDITFASISGSNPNADADFTTEDITFAANAGHIENDNGEAYFTTDDISMSSKLFLIEISNIPSPWRTSHG